MPLMVELCDKRSRASLMLDNVVYYIICIPLLSRLSPLILLRAMPMATSPLVLLLAEVDAG